MENYYLESIGKLLIHPDESDDWLISKKVPIPCFDSDELGFTFFINDFKDDCFLYEVDLVIQKFLKIDKTERLKFSSLIFENYKENYNDQNEYEDILEIVDERDIWSLVYPYQIIICSGDNDDKNIYIIFICDCEWEEEHGLQLVFKNGEKLTRVSAIDYAPTE